MSGYEIREFCRVRLRQFWNESFGQIYPTLTRLAEAGWIRRVDNEAKPRAAHYALTPEGRARLREWLAEPVAPRVVRDEVLLKLLCGNEAPPGVQAEHVGTAGREARKQLDDLRQRRDELETRAAGHPDLVHWRLMLRAGELILEARLRWCDEAAKALENDKP